MNTKSAAACLVLIAFPSLVFATDNSAPSGSLQGKLDALVSELVVCPWRPQRFVDNGDGTICDTRTGLMWEKKNAADGVQNLSNPHDVDNLYTWSSPEDSNSGDPDGTLYTDFIPKLNGAVAHFVESEQLGNYRDWRVPTLAELQTLVAEPCPSSGPCVINPIFRPAAKFLYWTSTNLPRDFIGISYAWAVFFNVGGAIDVDKSLGMHARAVRGGGSSRALPK
jgi:hypothetical protein